jgi:hypothetical protein
MEPATTVSTAAGVLLRQELASGALLAAMALGSVGLWTLRVAFAARGRKVLGAGTAAVEAVVFAIAFSNLAANLNSPVRVLGYAVGVAGGTLLGLAVDEWTTRDRTRKPTERAEVTARTCCCPSPQVEPCTT